MLSLVLGLVLLVVSLPLVGIMLYLFVLAIAAAVRPVRSLPTAPQRRFRVVIPAHDEGLVLEPVLRRLAHLQYPRRLYDVVVVADNCTDDTADVARRCGVRVLERHDTTARGKGHALAYAFAALGHEDFDAYVVLDADTLVAPDILDVFDRYGQAGYRALQAQYDVHEPWTSPRTALMYVAFRIMNYVRPLGRRALGLSTGLNGNGMCFDKQIIERFPWSAFSLVEDIEYTTTLLRANERILFVPEAHIYAQMPSERAAATAQRMRWERGRFAMARRHGWPLLADGMRRRDAALFDGGMDLLTPPLVAFGLAMGVGALLAALGAFLAPGLPTTVAFAVWTGLLVALLLFVLVCLAVARVPRQGYMALLHAPRFVVWKSWVYVLMIVRRSSRGWERTPRVVLRDADQPLAGRAVEPERRVA